MNKDDSIIDGTFASQAHQRLAGLVGGRITKSSNERKPEDKIVTINGLQNNGTITSSGINIYLAPTAANAACIPLPKTNNPLCHDEQSPSFDVNQRFVSAVNLAVETAWQTNLDVANRMNLALKAQEQIIVQHMVDKWFDINHPNSIPVHYLSSLCWAIGSKKPATVVFA